MKRYKFILFLFVITFVISCEDNDTLLPELTSIEPNIADGEGLDSFISKTLFNEGVVQELFDLDANPNPSLEEIQDVNEQVMNQIQNGSLTIALNGNAKVSGYVISNDQHGNFFEELIIQDKFSNPTIGVRVMLNESLLYSHFEVGRKVFIVIDGLFLGLSDGVLAIGGPTEADGGGNIEVTKVNSNLVDDVVLRTTEVATIEPKEITTDDFNNENENIFVKLSNMQFPVGSVLGNFPATFASEDGDEFNGERLIESCENSGTIEISTSTFASYIAVTLPNGQGEINGILTRDFFDNKYIFKLNDPSNIIFENGLSGRCDPIFVDSFDNDLNNWTTFSVTGPSQVWGITTFGNPAPSARISGFDGGAIENEDWLISNAIDLTNTTNPELNFQTVKRFDGPDMEVFMSTDYNGGDPTTDGTWMQLSVTLDTNTGSWTSWTNSGSIDVSDANGGNLFIAFKYISTSSNAATFEIDNVSISDL